MNLLEDLCYPSTFNTYTMKPKRSIVINSMEYFFDYKIKLSNNLFNSVSKILYMYSMKKAFNNIKKFNINRIIRKIRLYTLYTIKFKHWKMLNNYIKKKYEEGGIVLRKVLENRYIYLKAQKKASKNSLTIGNGPNTPNILLQSFPIKIIQVSNLKKIIYKKIKQNFMNKLSDNNIFISTTHKIAAKMHKAKLIAAILSAKRNQLQKWVSDLFFYWKSKQTPTRLLMKLFKNRNFTVWKNNTFKIRVLEKIKNTKNKGFIMSKFLKKIYDNKIDIFLNRFKIWKINSNAKNNIKQFKINHKMNRIISKNTNKEKILNINRFINNRNSIREEYKLKIRSTVLKYTNITEKIWNRNYILKLYKILNSKFIVNTVNKISMNIIRKINYYSIIRIKTYAKIKHVKKQSSIIHNFITTNIIKYIEYNQSMRLASANTVNNILTKIVNKIHTNQEAEIKNKKIEEQEIENKCKQEIEEELNKKIYRENEEKIKQANIQEAKVREIKEEQEIKKIQKNQMEKLKIHNNNNNIHNKIAIILKNKHAKLTKSTYTIKNMYFRKFLNRHKLNNVIKSAYIINEFIKNTVMYKINTYKTHNKELVIKEKLKEQYNIELQNQEINDLIKKEEEIQAEINKHKIIEQENNKKIEQENIKEIQLEKEERKIFEYMNTVQKPKPNFNLLNYYSAKTNTSHTKIIEKQTRYVQKRYKEHRVMVMVNNKKKEEEDAEAENQENEKNNTLNLIVSQLVYSKILTTNKFLFNLKYNKFKQYKDIIYKLRFLEYQEISNKTVDKILCDITNNIIHNNRIEAATICMNFKEKIFNKFIIKKQSKYFLKI